MSLKDVWKNFVNTGNIEYYVEYKNLQNKEKKDANNNRSSGNQNNGYR